MREVMRYQSRSHRKNRAQQLISLGVALQLLANALSWTRSFNESDEFSTMLKAARCMSYTRKQNKLTSSFTRYSGMRQNWKLHARPLSVIFPEALKSSKDRLKINRENLHRRGVMQLTIILTQCNSSQGGEVRGVFCDAAGSAISQTVRGLLKSSFCLRKLSQLSLRDRERALLRPNILRFAIIQHPFTRAFGTYRRFITNTTDPNSTEYRRFISRLRGHPLSKTHRELSTISFRIFLALSSQRLSSVRGNLEARPFQIKSSETKFIAQGVAKDEPSNDGYDEDDLLPQAWVCATDVVNFPVLVRAESFTEDIHALNRRLGIKTSSIPDLDVLSDISAAKEMFADVRVRHRASRLFRQDLSTFKYAPSL